MLLWFSYCLQLVFWKIEPPFHTDRDVSVINNFCHFRVQRGPHNDHPWKFQSRFLQEVKRLLRFGKTQNMPLHPQLGVMDKQYVIQWRRILLMHQICWDRDYTPPSGPTDHQHAIWRHDTCKLGESYIRPAVCCLGLPPLTMKETSWEHLHDTHYAFQHRKVASEIPAMITSTK